jgi:hypothetical protein
MNTISSHQFLSIYSWFSVSIVIFLLALIARFYERLSNARTYYRFFAVPVIAFAGASVRLAGLDRLTHDPLGDGLLLAGGVSLIILSAHMYRLMTSGR